METAYLGLSREEGFSPSDTLCLLNSHVKGLTLFVVGDSACRVRKSATYPKTTLLQRTFWEMLGSCWSPPGTLLKSIRRVISTGALASNCNEIPEIGWLKLIQMYFLTIQDPRIWNPSVLLWMSYSVRHLSWISFLVSCDRQQLLTSLSLWVPPSNVWICFLMVFSLCICVKIFLQSPWYSAAPL